MSRPFLRGWDPSRSVAPSNTTPGMAAASLCFIGITNHAELKPAPVLDSTACFHDLRRFRATQWVMQGVDLVTIQTLLGHESIETTMRYNHLWPTYTGRIVVEAQRKETLALQEKNRRERRERNLRWSNSTTATR